MSRERPIIFSGPMVCAILDGRKSVTRRICKGARELSCARDWPLDTCPFGVPGDRLWARETWALVDDRSKPSTRASGVLYRATDERASSFSGSRRWRPSIHMPRWASRLTLEVVSVRVERLQEITEEDAKAEGTAQALCNFPDPLCPMFAMAWERLHGPGSWAANPWVWAVSFRRVERAG